MTDARRRAAVEAILVSIAPAIAFWLMNFLPIGQNSFLDPYVYTGYIHNFVDLFNRYGMQYYGVRFGLILPAHITTSLFGPIAGYFVLRYVLVLVAGVPFYVLIKQRYGLLPAASVYVVWLTSPFLARTVLWDYPDATGVMFLFAAVCLFAIEHPRRRLLDAGAAVAAGMSIHSNLFALAPLSIFFAAYAVLWVWWGRGVAPICRRLLIIVAGVAVVSAVGATYYWWRIGNADIFSITLSMAQRLAGGGMEVWRVPGIAWLAQLWWALTPAIFVVLATIAYLQRRGDFHEALVWTSLTGTAAFFAISQFFLRADFLQLFYYFSYALPVVFLSLASIVASLWKGSDARTRKVSASVLLIAAIGPWLLRPFGIRYLVGSFAVHMAVVAVSLAFAATALRYRRPVLSVAASLALGFMFYSCFARGPHSGMVGRDRSNHIEMDVYRVALDFIRSVPSLSERAGDIRFWYHNRPPGSLQSVQSTFLWGFSKVQSDDPNRGLPYLDAPERARIQAAKWLTVLGERESELTAARAALSQNDIEWHPVRSRVLTAGNFTLYLDELEITKPSPSSMTFGAPIIDVTDRMPMDVNVYGARKGRLITDQNAVTFVPADERDHIAYPFVKLSLVLDAWARVQVVATGVASQSCQLLVQDQDFNSLATLGCHSTLDYVLVPSTTRAIRVNMTDKQLRPFTLPARIEVTLADRR